MNKRDNFKQIGKQNPSDDHYLVVQSRTLAAQIRRPDIHRSYLVPVLSKAFHIMRLLETNGGPLTMNEIWEKTGYSKTTVYRILRTLSAHGYLPSGVHGVYDFKLVPETVTEMSLKQVPRTSKGKKSSRA
jgi:transcription initiation factor IIE alpha subunit